MIVHTEVDKVEDGAITAVTLKVVDGDMVIQQCSFDILEEGTIAKAVGNSFELLENSDEYVECIKQILRTLEEHGIQSIRIDTLASSSNYVLGKNRGEGQEI